MKRLLVICCALACASALDNGLALTPPMGFMSWERYRCITDCQTRPDECISERLFKNITDMMVIQGYKAVGYKYVIIDDCWLEKERDANTSRLVADRKRFPSGMKALADYIHANGLLFGLYEDYGNKTCAGYPGVIDNMELDANTFAEWEVDYVKLDGCNSDPYTMDEGYPKFGQYLNATGRPMVYSCSWPVYQEEKGLRPDFEALKRHCNLWRNYEDIDDSYSSFEKISDYFAKNQERIQPHAGPGHWNDPDMLIIGNYGLSYDQSKAQMAIWAILAAPLLISADLNTITPEVREILQNQQVIAVNQDILGIQGKRIAIQNKIEIWTRPISPKSRTGNYSYAVAFVSRRDDGSPYDFKITPQEINLNNLNGYKVHDLFTKNVKSFIKQRMTDPFKVRINPSGVAFFKFTPY